MADRVAVTTTVSSWPLPPAFCAKAGVVNIAESAASDALVQNRNAGFINISLKWLSNRDGRSRRGVEINAQAISGGARGDCG
jgi:hypothetical protein